MHLTSHRPLSPVPPCTSLVRAFLRAGPVLCLLLMSSTLFGQGLPFFLEQARSGSEEEKAAAFEELATLKGPDVEAALAAGIANTSAMVRHAAAVCAIGHPSDVVTTALIQAFHDQVPDVQHTVISVFIMNNRPLPSGYRPLLSLLEAPDQKTRAYAAWAVGLYRNPGSLGRLKKLFDGGDELQRKNVCWAAGEIGNPDGLDLVHRGLTDGAAGVREKAAEAAGKIGHKDSVARLNTLLKTETDEAVKQAAGRSLETLSRSRTEGSAGK
jgi:HEAT repeat protein